MKLSRRSRKRDIAFLHHLGDQHRKNTRGVINAQVNIDESITINSLLPPKVVKPPGDLENVHDNANNHKFVTIVSILLVTGAYLQLETLSNYEVT